MKSKLIIIILIVFCFSAVAFAVSIEITTGSQNNEGIKNISGSWLRNGCKVQIIKAAGSVPHLPDNFGNPSNGDMLITETTVGQNFPFNPDQGKFDLQIGASGGDMIYIRAWDSMQKGMGIRYGDSIVYIVKGYDGEVWNIRGSSNSEALKTDKVIK